MGILLLHVSKNQVNRNGSFLVMRPDRHTDRHTQMHDPRTPQGARVTSSSAQTRGYGKHGSLHQHT